MSNQATFFEGMRSTLGEAIEQTKDKDDMRYEGFLESKFRFTNSSGFEVAADDLNRYLKPHCRDLVRWALKGGRRAIFAAFGLHKTSMQLEIMRQIGIRECGRQLLIAPLTPIEEFIEESERMGMKIFFVKSSAEVVGPGIYITNYESVRDGKIDVDLFNAVSLDEASVLRSYGSKTYQDFLSMFGEVKYRFVATATPSPNRHKELIHYAGFLGIMDTGQALTRFFQRDSEQANNLTLYPHMEAEFYTWLHSWAIFLQKPSDLGYSDEGYDLPPVTVRYHEVSVRQPGGKVDRDGQIQLVNDAAIGLKDAADEKRSSIAERVAKLKEIVQESPEDHFILWHDLEAEREAIKQALPDSSDVYGSQDMNERNARLKAFRDGLSSKLSTKPKIAGSGGNFQKHCHRAIFVGISYKFNDFIQSIYRLQRFGQKFPVEIDIIYTETERVILQELQRKWEEDTELRARMSAIIQRYGLSTSGMEDELRRTIGVQRQSVKGEMYEMVLNDCTLETARMEGDSVDLIHTSIPFGNHYEYSPSYNDFGHNEDNAAFFRQMDFLTPNLLRILRPGRLAAIHVKDRIRFGNVTGDGMPTVDPFHSDCITHYIKHGFRYMGMITVVTDVVRENNQTYRLGWSEQCKDGSKMGVGTPEYVLLFRKLPTDTAKAYADIKVEKSKAEYTRSRWQTDAHAFWRSSGNRLLATEELAELNPDQIGKAFKSQSLDTVYNHEDHVAIGEALDRRGVLPATFMSLAPGSHHPDVWDDVNRMLTLNGSQAQRNLTNHICPLQFDIVDRIIRRYTNEGEKVYDPFAGIGTVPLRAVKMGRRGIGTELNPESFKDAVMYLREAEAKRNIPTLFDAIPQDSEVA